MPSQETIDTKLWQALPDEQKTWPVLSYSQLSKFNSCKFEWYIRYVLQFSTEKGEALEIGSMLHTALGSMYEAVKAGTPAEAWFMTQFEDLVRTWITDSKAVQYVAHVTWLMERYSANQSVMDLGHSIWDIERHFLIPVRSRKGRPFLIQGYIDLITIDSNGTFWIWDHKSGQQFWTLGEAEMDPQLPLYAIAEREEGLAFNGQIINQIRTYDYKKPQEVPNEKLFKRDPIYRSDEELIGIARTILTRADVWLDALETRAEPVRNLRRDCKFCSFRTECKVSLSGIPVEEVLELSSHKRKSGATQSTLPDSTGIILEM